MIAKILIIVTLFISSSLTSNFYNTVVKTYRGNSFFLSFQIISQNFKGNAIIENNDLFHYFHEQKGFSKERYESLIIKKLIKKQKLEIISDDIESIGFIKIKEIDSIKIAAKQGAGVLLKQFFNDKILKKVSIDEKNTIIHELFMLKIACHIDDVSGHLVQHSGQF